MNRERKLALALLGTFLSGVVATGLLYFYVGYAINKDNQRTCRLYELIYQPQPDTPEPDPNSRAGEVKKEIGKLIEYYHCR